MSICNGIIEIIDHYLEVEDIGRKPHFAHKTSCLRLSKGPPAGVDVEQMISEMLECLEKNWEKSPRRKYAEPSNENWRFKKQLYISSKNTSPEKLVEKGIIHIHLIIWLTKYLQPLGCGITKATGIEMLTLFIV